MLGCRLFLINVEGAMGQIGIGLVLHREAIFGCHNPFVAFVIVRLILERIIVRVVQAALRVLAHFNVFVFLGKISVYLIKMEAVVLSLVTFCLIINLLINIFHIRSNNRNN